MIVSSKWRFHSKTFIMEHKLYQKDKHKLNDSNGMDSNFGPELQIFHPYRFNRQHNFGSNE